MERTKFLLLKGKWYKWQQDSQSYISVCHGKDQ